MGPIIIETYGQCCRIRSQLVFYDEVALITMSKKNITTSLRRFDMPLCPNDPLLPVLPSQVDEDVALDQAMKFCQIQLATSAQRQVKYNYATFFPGSPSLMLKFTYILRAKCTLYIFLFPFVFVRHVKRKVSGGCDD